MNAMKKLFAIIFIGFILMCSTLYAQVFYRLPDDFEEKYSSLDAYYKAQEEEALIAEQKAAEEAALQEQLDRLLEAFYNNDWTEFFNDEIARAKRMNEQYRDIERHSSFVLFSSEPFEVGYILQCEYVEIKDSYDYFVSEDIFVYSLNVESKKCTLLECCDENDELVQNILKHNERIAEIF